MKDAKEILRETLAERTSANSGYSLRAFARDLGVSPQQLSNVMNGKRGMSPELAQKVCFRLGLTEAECEIFVESLQAEFARSPTRRLISQAKLSQVQSESSTRNLELDYFKAISNWHHFTLLELIKLSHSKPKKLSWFAQKLGIGENEVSVSLNRLERLELISRENNRWKVNQDVVNFDRATPPDAVKKYHRQILEKAISSLAFQDSNERYGSSSSMPIKLKDVRVAKKMIQDFRMELNKAIAAPTDGEEVYALSIQFFRLTEKTNERSNKE